MADDFDASALLIAIDLVEQGGMPEQATQLRKLVGPVQIPRPDTQGLIRSFPVDRIEVSWDDGTSMTGLLGRAPLVFEDRVDYVFDVGGRQFQFAVMRPGRAPLE